MEDIVLNDELRLPVPDGFHVMSEEEKKNLRFLEAGPCVCLSDPERHILVTAGWKQAGGLASLLLNCRDIAENAEKRARAAMRDQGYHCQGFLKKRIADTTAEGFRYAYTAQEVEMVSETFAAKLGKTIYYFNFYARAALDAESTAVWNELLRSVSRSK